MINLPIFHPNPDHQFMVNHCVWAADWDVWPQGLLKCHVSLEKKGDTSANKNIYWSIGDILGYLYMITFTYVLEYLMCFTANLIYLMNVDNVSPKTTNVCSCVPIVHPCQNMVKNMFPHILHKLIGETMYNYMFGLSFKLGCLKIVLHADKR